MVPSVTYSIVARDPATGELGVAIQSKVLAAGSIVAWAKADVGAVATQAWANRFYGPDGLGLLEQGVAPKDVAARLTGADPDRDRRQLGIVDARGNSFSWTGQACISWAGGRHFDNVAVQANLCAGPQVVDAMFERHEAGGLRLPELLVDCLAKAEAAGGDRRGMQAAGLLSSRRPARAVRTTMRSTCAWTTTRRRSTSSADCSRSIASTATGQAAKTSNPSTRLWPPSCAACSKDWARRPDSRAPGRCPR